ncbi:hypothetical protein ACXR2T_03530 [Leucobacter sp. HY1910]
MAKQVTTLGGFGDPRTRGQVAQGAVLRATHRRVRRLLWALPVAGALALGLAGCAPEPGATAENPPAAAADPERETAAKPVQEPEVTEETPKEQAPAPQDCGWGAERVAADLSAVPSGQEGDLADVLPGSWQHVGIDEGAGYDTDLGADIRYVFPSTSEVIYCQDVPGITDQAENRVAFELAGTEIVLPAPATGYAVQSWSDSAMVWLNHRDGSLYLLQRR